MYVCRYGTAELEDEGGYIALEFSCLRPAAENLGLLGAPERYPGARNDYRFYSSPPIHTHTYMYTYIHVYLLSSQL